MLAAIQPSKNDEPDVIIIFPLPPTPSHPGDTNWLEVSQLCDLREWRNTDSTVALNGPLQAVVSGGRSMHALLYWEGGSGKQINK